MKKKWNEIPIGGMIEGATGTQNKTGGWRSFRPITDFGKCIHCMICVANCPDMAIPAENEKRLETNLDFCKGCGICAEVCPVKAIKMEEEGD